jgi:Zn-dependent metalloprotease
MGYTAEQVYDQYREIFERFEFDLNGKALMAKVSKKYAEID